MKKNTKKQIKEISPEEVSLKLDLNKVIKKMKILSSQTHTKERIQEGVNLLYEKEQLEYDLMKINPEDNKYETKTSRKLITKKLIAKNVRSIKSYLRM